ncbi:MAG: hypothetical protein JXB26_08450 [Candidatus Aminicenantes bacterium]|nr:hypothetical protein [Candidatus Aminicenantes bacterium]
MIKKNIYKWKKGRPVFIIFGLAQTALMLSAHGVRIDVVKKIPMVCIQAVYEGGDPLGFSSVSIRVPGNPPEDFQSGWTDAHGRFAFVPDRAGKWLVLVDDEMGHRDETVVEIAAEFIMGEKDLPDAEQSGQKMSPQKEDIARIPLVLRIFVGLSLIFGATGIYYWIKAHKLLRSEKKRE